MSRQENLHFLMTCSFVCAHTLLGWLCGNAAAQGPGSTGVAVLNDGRVFQGTVQEVPGGYRIQYPGGSSILPFDQISVTSVNLVGAYEAFRENIKTPSADAHLRLAEWCLANGLYAQADMEIQSALKLEPLRTDAKVLLRQVDLILRPEAVAAKPTAPAAPASRAAISVAAFTSPAERTAVGLSRDTQLEFMRKVQPLLINKCGNAGCHGQNVENQLRLKNARHDSPGLRAASEKNLAMLMSLIDTEHPERSPLLLEPLRSSDHHKNLFFGARQEAQFEILDRWVKQVASERSQSAPVAGTKSKVTPPETGLAQHPPIQQAAAFQIVPEKTPAQFPAIGQGKPLNSSTNPGAAPATDPEFLNQIRQAQRPDQFDPGEFNRLMHPGK
ncbi:hypothetical protein SH661x_000688 [Planctomicrobium sp. SH661]|uniref:hypothetical protein n=1 Tax=Planctomicrobium sp. SH661 TaxID=3448124 RepID=UPI003F5B61E7